MRDCKRRYADPPEPPDFWEQHEEDFADWLDTLDPVLSVGLTEDALRALFAEFGPVVTTEPDYAHLAEGVWRS